MDHLSITRRQRVKGHLKAKKWHRRHLFAQSHICFSGDGGNRTRVRKIRPSNFYERSRSYMSPNEPQPAEGFIWPAAGTRKLLFRTVSDIPYGTLALYRPVLSPARERDRRT